MKYFSLFSGAGGFEIGIKNAYERIFNEVELRRRGQEKNKLEATLSVLICESNKRQSATCVGFSEIDKYASQVLKFRFPETKNYGDIKTINWSDVPDFDLLVGGSPCQDLSVAGKQKGLSGERSGLFFEYIRCLKEKQPAMFIWENVKGALSSSNGWDFDRVQIEMAEVGYDVQWQVLNAKDFGVPQNRERVFVIGHLRGTSVREIFFERGNNEQTLKQVIGGSQGYRVYETNGVSTTLASEAGGLGAKTGLYAVDLSMEKPKITEQARTIQARYSKGYSNRSGEVSGVLAVPVLTPDRIEKRQNGRRFKNDGEPMFTLNTQDKHGVFNGAKIRRLTPKECERLMSWPDDWTRYGINEKGETVEISDSQRYKMCGNGVVSKVVENIMDYLCQN